MIDTSTLKYRTTREIRVVPYNRMSSAIGDAVDTGAEFIDDGFGFVVQTSRAGDQAAQRVSEIDKETALLLLTLREPGCLPDYLLSSPDLDTKNGILNLLYSGMIEAEIEGEFLSGTQAAAYFNNQDQSQDSSADIATLISHNALKRADQMGLIYEDQLFNYLYQYNTIPVSPTRRRQLDNDKEFLNLAKISSIWQYSDSMEGWHYFSDSRSSSMSYMAKLYVSPCVDQLPEVLLKTSEVLTAFPGVSFKVGAGCMGALRSDKLVIYFDSIERLMQAADALSVALKGIDAHGVPFTSRISPDGLISWGMDPKESNAGRKSWRQWVIEKLSAYMLRNDKTQIEQDRWKLALAQLELEGINSNTFRPGGSWITEYS